MDRFRRGERDRDDPDTYHLGAGESYRPGGGRPDESARPAADRRDVRKEDIDSYVPSTSSRMPRTRSRSPPAGTFRRRSRSPAGRGREETYPSRARTPPRRYSPRRDVRPRSPPRRRSRSPYRTRPRSPPVDARRRREFSPDPKRSPRRDTSDRPRFDRPRSPPRRPFSSGRDSGRDSRPRSRTPARRDDYKAQYPENVWRKRSPSPTAPAPDSHDTSRRSSPPVHPDRTSLTGSAPRSPAYQSRSVHDPTPPRSFPDRSRDSPPREYPAATQTQPPTGPGGPRNGSYDRAPPSGPSRTYSQSSQVSPSGTSPGPSVSAHNRSIGSTPTLLSAPTRPRGAPPGRFDAPRDYASPSAPRGRGPTPYRGSMPSRTSSYQHSEASTYNGPRGGGYGRADYGSRGDYSARGDYGGRGDYSGRGDYGARGGYGRGASDNQYPFRSSNSTSTTYPQTKHFNTTANYLATREQIVPGGKLQPSGLPPEQDKKIKTLEAEAERIRKDIDEKQRVKRAALREWEVRERESDREALKSELAEKHLQKLSEGEDGMGAAF